MIGRTPCPVRIEPWKEADTVVGVRQVSDYMAKVRVFPAGEDRTHMLNPA